MRGIKAKGKWMAWVKNYRNVFIAIKVAVYIMVGKNAYIPFIKT